VSDSRPILEARGLCRDVGPAKAPKRIVDDFSFQFYPGKVYTFLGPSGAGKSSILRLFNRLDEPSAGDVVFQGKPACDYPPCDLRTGVGYLFQVPYLFPGTVRDNLLFANDNITNERMAELIRITELEPNVLDRDSESLSVGQKQRVALARLLATDPKVVLLDEPTAALDPTITERIETVIRKLATEQKLAVLMVSHHPQQALRVGDEGLLIVAGRLIEHGPVQQLVNAPQTDQGKRYRDRELT